MTADALEETRRASDFASPTPDEDDRLRGLIRAELDRQHVMPLARRTLELLAEAEIEPSRSEPGYRVIDRSGETRLIRDSDAGPEEGGDVTAPMTLRGLVAELRERHPDLFSTAPDPEEVDAVPPPPAKPEEDHDRLAEMRAAGARFVESQTALARSLATTSAERGRDLATAASGRFGTWRERLDARFRRGRETAAQTATEIASGAAPGQPSAQPSAGPSARLSAPLGGANVRARLAGAVHRGREALPRLDRDLLSTHRLAIVTIGGTVLLVAGLIVANLPFRKAEPQSVQDRAPAASGRQAGTNPADAVAPQTGMQTGVQTGPRSGGQSGAQPANGAGPPAAASAPAGSEPTLEDAEAAPVDDPPPRNPNDVAGVPQVIDTATLKVSGKVIHLFGVEWVRGGQAEELTKYIRGRGVTCRPASGSSAFVCTIEGRDLSEVVLFNGGGRASSEASPDLVAAEDHARTERLGIWKR